MGFDAHRYEVTKTVSIKELPNLEEIEMHSNLAIKVLTPKMERWLLANGLGLEHRRERDVFNVERWLEQYPQYKHWEWVTWDLSGEQRWATLQNEQGEQVTVNEGFEFEKEPIVVIQEYEIGYMRKPFRHSERAPITEEEGTITITVTNFSDKGAKAFEMLRAYDPLGVEDANLDIMEASFIRKLAPKSYDPKQFRQQMLPQSDREYVNFNW